jgi:hypothetical protein
MGHLHLRYRGRQSRGRDIIFALLKKIVNNKLR